MRRAVVSEMATLAKRREIARIVVPGVLIQMGCGQHHICPWQRQRREACKRWLPRDQEGRGWQCPQPAPAVIPPSLPLFVPPDAIRPDDDALQMRSPALLAAAASTIKADDLRQFALVDWVEPTLARADRHDDSMNQRIAEQKR